MTGEGLVYIEWSGKNSEEKTTEQILNAVVGKPCRYLKREHSSRGNKCNDRSTFGVFQKKQEGGQCKSRGMIRGESGR